MMKQVLLAGSIFTAGMGFCFAQDTTPVNAHVAAKKEAHIRIVKLIDRIEAQRARINSDLEHQRITEAQAQTCRGVLDNVVTQMKDEQKANGASKTMTNDQYEAYNTALDANSAAINEQKGYFYYYGSYTERGPYYNYNYDGYPDTAAPVAMTTGEKKYPRIYELKDRIENQTIRIDEQATTKTITDDQARNARLVISNVKTQIKNDYLAAGSKTMTRANFLAYNTALDANSAVLHEQRHAFYYYGPYYERYYYWD
jgi:hypothetical protein